MTCFRTKFHMSNCNASLFTPSDKKQRKIFMERCVILHAKNIMLTKAVHFCKVHCYTVYDCRT